MTWFIVLIVVFFFLMPLLRSKTRQKEEIMRKRMEMENAAAKKEEESPYDFVSSGNGNRVRGAEPLFPGGDHSDALSENFSSDAPSETSADTPFGGEEGQRTLCDVPRHLRESIRDNEISAPESAAKKRIKKIDGKDMVIYSEIIKPKF